MAKPAATVERKRLGTWAGVPSSERKSAKEGAKAPFSPIFAKNVAFKGLYWET